MIKEICDIKELSTYLSISIPEIRKMVREQEIPHFRLGNRIRFDKKSINNWIEKLEEKQQIGKVFY